MTDLEKLWRTSKCNKPMAYAPLYEQVIGPRRLDPIRILEIGVWRGGSLRAWWDWCPNAEITGIDTFERQGPETVDVLSRDRVRWFRKNSAGSPPEDIGTFDFIIDDGCHWHCAQRMTFYRYWPLLNPGGTYFIEDVWPFDLMDEQDKRHQWVLNHPGAWTDDAFRGLMKDVTDASGQVFRHDFRGKPNYYIIEVRK